jgi:hypothetical protein
MTKVPNIEAIGDLVWIDGEGYTLDQAIQFWGILKIEILACDRNQMEKAKALGIPNPIQNPKMKEI